ncbi:hypothetical protein GPECTOR_7g1025 [Gonium pectorale]|uniref:Exocyst complex component Sec10-like alpha-helical bundle domain-containing protein n=1 Tax=Gonium pectorale TaxID=33097 RepID=A0A150GTM7_GONPE|nr:hypothetical protein GPECTOR_7g1025 [Gonium pectorale]|eukprot:KXZ53134.1 hypothetical protein GPECTOR_7g1025 [Gonium pectorale]
MVLIQAEKTLMIEQKRSEFLPPGDQLDAGTIDRPTDACLLVAALLEELGRVSRSFLDGSNAASFLLEVGTRVHATLLNHMRQYVYNAAGEWVRAGALRWRNDVARYGEALRGWGLPALDARMAAAGSLVGLLLVEPQQLMPLVNGTLRLDHREAIQYVRLRQDFPVARVNGRSLQQLFGGEEALPGQGAQGQGQGLPRPPRGAAGPSGGR